MVLIFDHCAVHVSQMFTLNEINRDVVASAWAAGVWAPPLAAFEERAKSQCQSSGQPLGTSFTKKWWQTQLNLHAFSL